MSPRARFYPPSDPNWQGGHRSHHIFFLLKTFLLGVWITLIIAHYVSLYKWRENDRTTWYFRDNHVDQLFWWRRGISLIPDIIFTLLTFLLFFQTPRITTHSRPWTFHPGVALAFALPMPALYAFTGTMNMLSVWSWERPAEDLPGFERVAQAEMGVQFVMGGLYVFMVVAACVAVHRWRKGEERRKSEVVVLEMGRK